MYFLQQFLSQFTHEVVSSFQEGPGNPGWTPEAAAERATKKEAESGRTDEDRLTEMAQTASETTTQMETRV